MISATREWLPVSHREPCPVCGRPDWCSRSADGQRNICRRRGRPDAIERQDKNGAAYWVHVIGDAPPTSSPLPPSPPPERAAAEDLDQVYRALLAKLRLDGQHHQALRQRGLNDADIQQHGYRTLPLTGRARVATMLVQQYGADLCATAPGIVRRQGDHGRYWTISGAPGLLLPVRNLDSAIVGLVVRVDDPGDGGKYRWLSSRHHDGHGPDVQCHIPMFNGNRHIIRITEGQLKADAATALSGILTIGAPGVSNWRLALPILERLKPETILIAWDSDWRYNRHVALSLGDAAKTLHKQGYHVMMEDWDPHVAKGVDDLLSAGHSPTRKGWLAAVAGMFRGTGSYITPHYQVGATTCQK